MIDVMVAKGIRLLELVLGVSFIVRQRRAVCKRAALRAVVFRAGNQDRSAVRIHRMVDSALLMR